MFTQEISVLSLSTPFLTKVLYIANICGNILILNKFLETDGYSVYGLGVISDLLNGVSWMETDNFPRVTLCDFEVHRLLFSAASLWPYQ